MNLNPSILRKAFNILFLLVFTVLAILHIKQVIRFDAISLSLLVIGMVPILLPYINRKLLPYINRNFRSFELFGIKAELLERKLEKQEEELRQQQQIIHELVVYSMAFYLYEMLRDFDRCEKGEMKEYIFRKSASFEHNLRCLRDNGYLEMTFKIASLRDGENIAQRVKLTPIGKFYIDLRANYKIKKQAL